MFHNFPSSAAVAMAILTFLGSILLSGLLYLVLAWPVSLLWNWLMPEVFGLPILSYWQAAGLIMLLNLLLNINFSFGAKTSSERSS